MEVLGYPVYKVLYIIRTTANYCESLIIVLGCELVFSWCAILLLSFSPSFFAVQAFPFLSFHQAEEEEEEEEEAWVERNLLLLLLIFFAVAKLAGVLTALAGVRGHIWPRFLLICLGNSASKFRRATEEENTVRELTCLARPPVKISPPPPPPR